MAQSDVERTFFMKLWPPAQNTRLMMVEQMTASLCAESLFSKRCGLFSEKEAKDNAKRIEDVAFLAANDYDGDGISAMQLYAFEASNLMFETLNRGPAAKAIEHGLVVKAVKRMWKSLFYISGTMATELLRPLEEPGNSYTRICFSHQSFGVEAARVAERMLMGVRKNLTDVELTDIIVGRPKPEALQVMSIFSSVLEGCDLRSLNLSDNALDEKGVRAVGSLLKSQKSLEELYFMNNNISVEAARAICELLPSVEKLKILHFHNDMTGDDGAEALSELVRNCIALEDFRCSATRVGSLGGVALAGALGAGNRLKRLDSTYNRFGKKGGVALSRAISGHLGLTEAYLSNLGFQDEGTIALANSLKQGAPSLRVFEIAGNDITPKAAPALAECLAVKNLLTKFVASDNELKDEGTVLISRALIEGHENLRELDLTSNSITRIGAKAAAEAVANKPDFNLLNIDLNFISEEGIDVIKDVLRKGVKGVSVLGPLKYNAEEDEGDEEEREGDNEDDDGQESSDCDDELKKLQNLKM